MNRELTQPEPDYLDKEIYRSMLLSGAAFPVTPDEVRAAKARIKRKGSNIPVHLSNPKVACAELLRERACTDNVVRMPPNAFSEVKEELKRAARNGKSALSPLIEEKMRANRNGSRLSHG